MSVHWPLFRHHGTCTCHVCRHWTSLRLLLSTIGRTLIEVAHFGILLALFIFIAALAGLQLYANHLHFDPHTGATLLLSTLVSLQ